VRQLANGPEIFWNLDAMLQLYDLIGTRQLTGGAACILDLFAPHVLVIKARQIRLSPKYLVCKRVKRSTACLLQTQSGSIASSRTRQTSAGEGQDGAQVAHWHGGPMGASLA
jgi:hypothetical protein